MSSFSRWQSGSAVFLSVGMVAGSVAPIVTSAQVSAQQANFSDVSLGYWARPFIQVLATEGVISGFPNGTFQPDKPVTRAEFAAIVRQAFDESSARSPRSFSDVPASYWAASAVDKAYVTGFMSGYPEGTFQPNQQIPKVQALVSLASGLRLTPSGSASNALSVYSDAGQIPAYATEGVAAATQKNIVVNYPNAKFLNPNETATRADVAAFIYQALVSQKKIQPLAKDSPATKYIAGSTSGVVASDSTPAGATSDTDSTPTQNPDLRIARDTTIAVKYPDAKTVAVTQGETRPITLLVAKDVKNAKGQVLIPIDSQIVGQLVSRYDGSRKFLGVEFVAQRLRIGNQTYPVTNLSSAIVGSQPVNAETVKGTDASQAVQDLIGAVLGGQGTNAQKQEQAANEIIVINPATQLQLTVGTDFYVKSGS